MGLLLAGFLTTTNPAAQAADLFFVGGRGEGVDVASLGLRFDPFRTWTSGHGWEYALSGEVQIGGWRGRDSQPVNRDIVDTSFTPMLRLRPPTSGNWRPYLELGIGAHLLSHTAINRDTHFGSAFQFGEILGAGVELGQRNQYGLGVRVQHLSNGGIKHQQWNHDRRSADPIPLLMLHGASFA